MAHQLFPGGINCQPEIYYEYNKALTNTRQALDHGRLVIYEAAFFFNGVFIYADMLVEDEEGWKVYEVKSSTSVKEINIQDAALQSYVIEQNGINSRMSASCSTTPMNVMRSRWRNLPKPRLGVGQKIITEDSKEMKDLRPLLIKRPFPKIQETHCRSPYTCDFMGQCWDHILKTLYLMLQILVQKRNLSFTIKGLYLSKHSR